MARSHFLKRLTSSTGFSSHPTAESDTESVFTDEISLYDTDFDDNGPCSPAQDPKRDSETTKVSHSEFDHTKSGSGPENKLKKLESHIEYEHGVDIAIDGVIDEDESHAKNDDLQAFAAQAAKARRKRFRDESGDFKAEPELEGSKGPFSSCTVDANVESELEPERVKSWVTFQPPLLRPLPVCDPNFVDDQRDPVTNLASHLIPEVSATAPAPPPKDNTKTDASRPRENEEGKLKRALKRLFCIGSSLVSTEQMYHVQLPLAPIGRQHAQNIGPATASHQSEAFGVAPQASIAPSHSNTHSRFETVRSVATCLPVIDIH